MLKISLVFYYFLSLRILTLFSIPRDELLTAVLVADLNSVKLLLFRDPEIQSSKYPINVNRQEADHGRTSAMLCGYDPQYEDLNRVDKDCVVILSMLLEKGANLTLVDRYKGDALSLAAVRGFNFVSKYLVENEVTAIMIHRQDINGTTPLMKAAAHSHISICKLLMLHGARLDIRDKSGFTALHHITNLVMSNSSFINQFDHLLEWLQSNQSIDLNTIVDNDQRTILMYASINNNVPLTQLLVDKFHMDSRLKDNYDISTISMTSSVAVRNTLLEGAVRFTEKDHEEWLKTKEKQLKTAKKKPVKIKSEF